jgi:tRNA(His) 5'-end guanylyltransferase
MGIEMNSLENRMKMYEDVYRHKVLPRMPLILRLDGKAFHTLTRNCEKPFDKDLAEALDCCTIILLKEIQNARMAYLQSDEISILLIDYNKFISQQWFDGNIQKMVSISASIASSTFREVYGKTGYFDSRVIVLPEREVVNYFIWRQQDAERNSIQMVAQSLYNQKQLYKKDMSDLQEMIFQKGQNWNNLDTYWKRGRVFTKSGVDGEIPIFANERGYIEQFLKIEEN